MSKEFKVGDIVSHSSGRIANGCYGEIVLDWDKDLMVLDNEGAPDMSVAGNEEDLTVVGDVKNNAELLKIFCTKRVCCRTGRTLSIRPRRGDKIYKF